MSSKSFECKYEGHDCVSCGEPLLLGQTIRFKVKGAKDMEHETCPKKAVPPPPSMPGRPETNPEIRQETLFVQIAAWVPVDKLEIVTKAIREARS